MEIVTLHRGYSFSMTIIVGLIGQDGDGAVIASDSRSIDPENLKQQHVTTSKVGLLHIGGHILTIGIAGSWRVSQLVRHLFSPSPPGRCESIMQWLSGSFNQSLRGLLRSNDALRLEGDGGVASMDAELLLVYRGLVYVMQSDFSLLRDARPFGVVGGGYVSAFSSLYTSGALGVTDIRERALVALEAAASIDVGVGRPFNVISVPQGRVSASLFSKTERQIGGD